MPLGIASIYETSQLVDLVELGSKEQDLLLHHSNRRGTRAGFCDERAAGFHEGFRAGAEFLLSRGPHRSQIVAVHVENAVVFSSGCVR